MKVSAVGFLFQNKLNGRGVKGNNYTCVIHKITPSGNYSKNVVTSPIVKKSHLELVTPFEAKNDVVSSLQEMTRKGSDNKFLGATIKDGIKETEIHSLFSDKLFAVRTKDEAGKNHFRVLTRNAVQKTLAKNLYITA